MHSIVCIRGTNEDDEPDESEQEIEDREGEVDPRERLVAGAQIAAWVPLAHLDQEAHTRAAARPGPENLVHQTRRPTRTTLAELHSVLPCARRDTPTG